MATQTIKREKSVAQGRHLTCGNFGEALGLEVRIQVVVLHGKHHIGAQFCRISDRVYATLIKTLVHGVVFEMLGALVGCLAVPNIPIISTVQLILVLAKILIINID